MKKGRAYRTTGAWQARPERASTLRPLTAESRQRVADLFELASRFSWTWYRNLVRSGVKTVEYDDCLEAAMWGLVTEFASPNPVDPAKTHHYAVASMRTELISMYRSGRVTAGGARPFNKHSPELVLHLGEHRDEFAGADPRSNAPAEAIDARDWVRVRIGDLKPSERALVEAVGMNEMTFKEAAATVGPKGASHACRKYKECLETLRGGLEV